MKVYRVYESYHYDDESGTVEYGCYSTLELAQARMNVVWDAQKYGERSEKYSSPTRILSASQDGPSIGIVEITVDEDTNDTRVGYT
jgi:hypothetical protein